MKLSVVVPARDEAPVIGTTIGRISAALDAAGADFEIVVVDDGSRDGTAEVVRAAGDERLRVLTREPPHGFGRAVRDGLAAARGEGVVIVMADGSEDPADVVRYHELLEEGWACVFGTRHGPGGRVEGYGAVKLALNRAVNALIRALFGHGHGDTTNAFKAYRREVLEDVAPLVSPGFELTVELPLKAVVRGHRFATTPVSWVDRTAGRSKFRLRSTGPYALVVVRLLLERRLRRPAVPAS